MATVSACADDRPAIPEGPEGHVFATLAPGAQAEIGIAGFLEALAAGEFDFENPNEALAPFNLTLSEGMDLDPAFARFAFDPFVPLLLEPAEIEFIEAINSVLESLAAEDLRKDTDTVLAEAGVPPFNRIERVVYEEFFRAQEFEILVQRDVPLRAVASPRIIMPDIARLLRDIDAGLFTPETITQYDLFLSPGVDVGILQTFSFDENPFVPIFADPSRISNINVANQLLAEMNISATDVVTQLDAVLQRAGLPPLTPFEKAAYEEFFETDKYGILVDFEAPVRVVPGPALKPTC